MTNKHLTTKWKELAIEFKSSKEVKAMVEMFLVCVGETQIDVGGKNEIVVGYFEGYNEKGSPSVFLKSDKKDRCWAFAYNSEKETHVKANIGRFVKYKPEKKKTLTTDNSDLE